MSTLDAPPADPRSAPPAKPAGVIHDIGYQRYAGARLGRLHILAALYLHSLRTAFGLGRPAKSKIFPWLIISLVSVIAVVLTAVRAQTGQTLMTYLDFPKALTFLIIFFCAIVAPELVSRDLHSHTLPLYFARPLHRNDYVAAKLAAFVSATFLMLAGPLTVLFIGASFSTGELSAVWREFLDYLPGLASVGIHAVICSAVALLVAALVRRRAVAAGAIVAVFLLTAPIVGVLSLLPSRTVNQLAGLASPIVTIEAISDWLFDTESGFDIGRFGPLYGAAGLGLVVVCVLLLLARYRKVAAA